MEIINLRKLEGLAARRKAAGYTQETFAEALGVQRGALSMWETLKAFPSAGILPAIADLLLCTVDDLYKAPEEETTPHQSPAATASPQGEALEDSIPDREEA